ncbi:TonB-dependent receptor [Roseisolibacter sp. H3M3-2]|uniref:TonB-dependent receptor n=1 Tax=Roseisolibacter sp. H3M3-2 TaxID=3031323 RepID=UPI0023DA42AF|nr:TonB-dependent receptor [Roseisolibacter sp. H3M3-2]MDF1502185.1 TonB-dependent receptor [Roseisolibacter sp. H3M3-2]
MTPSLLVAALAAAVVQDTVPRTPRDTARARSLETVTVQAVRGGDAAAARTTLGAPQLRRGYTGQDVPLLLQQAPGVTTFAQSGSQWNYSYFRLRGMDQSRINLTLDGIPLNEPEDQQLYFSNFADLASSIRSVQIQRGVGTSTYGQSSFAGSVNFETVPLAATAPGGEVQLGGGSFGALRGTGQWASGLRDDRTAYYARFSNQRADGYRRGSSHAGNSAMASAGWFGDRDLLKLTLLTGAESNGQAYTAVPLETLRRDPRANPIDGVGDRFRQSMAALTYTRLLSESASLATTLYGFDAGGWYEYPTWVEGTPAPRWELASRWGGFLSALHAARGRTTFDAGVHALTYKRDHMFDDRPDLESPGYSNRGTKQEGSAFAKLSRTAGAFTGYADLQLRAARFGYRPTEGSPVPSADAWWGFVNPRVGMRWQASPTLQAFASVGSTGREPTRADLLAGADDVGLDDVDALFPLTRVKPERVRDFELGAAWTRGAGTVRANGYAMEFRDEIALVGLTTPLGYDVRRNVGRSYRRGVELEASWRPAGPLALAASAALSRNRIRSYRDESTGAEYRDVPTVLTPSLVTTQQATWRVARPLSLTLDGRYQSRQHLDPTGDLARTAPAFFALDGGALLHVGRHEILVQGRNLLDRFALTAGDISSSGVPRYFILAPRSVEVNARLRF